MRITDEELLKVERYVELYLGDGPGVSQELADLARAVQRYVAEVRRLRTLVLHSTASHEVVDDLESAVEAGAIRAELEARATYEETRR